MLVLNKELQMFFRLLDTDDSIPMTFEDVEDVHLLADFYMFTSQVDGEQDLFEETAGVKKNPTMLAQWDSPCPGQLHQTGAHDGAAGG